MELPQQHYIKSKITQLRWNCNTNTYDLREFKMAHTKMICIIQFQQCDLLNRCAILEECCRSNSIGV